MKDNELREMQTAELTSKLADLKAELFNLHQPAGEPRPHRSSQEGHRSRDDRSG